MLKLDFETISKALWEIPLPDVDCVVGIATGGIMPASLIAHQLRRPLFLVEINYRAPNNSPQRPAPEPLGELPVIPQGARILLVDDVSVTGKTLHIAKSLFAGHSVITFTLKGCAEIVLFPDIVECVHWPWKL